MISAGLLLALTIRPAAAADPSEVIQPAPNVGQHLSGPWYKDCRVWSTLSLVAAHSFDAASSWNGIEANPALNGGQPSRFGARAAALKFSFTGGYLVLQSLFMKKYPESRKAWCTANYAGAAVIGAVAIRNLNVAH